MVWALLLLGACGMPPNPLGIEEELYFGNYTPAARMAIHSALEHAKRGGSAEITSEDLVIGVLQSERDARGVIESMGLSADALLMALSQDAPEVAAGPQLLRLAPGTKRILRAALDESKARGNAAKLCGVDILLAVLANGAGDLGKRLEEEGLSLAGLHAAVVKGNKPDAPK